MSVCARVLAAALMAGAIAAALSFPAFVGDKATTVPRALTAPPAAARQTVHVATAKPPETERQRGDRRARRAAPTSSIELASVRIRLSEPARAAGRAAASPPATSPGPPPNPPAPRPPSEPTPSAPTPAPATEPPSASPPPQGQSRELAATPPAPPPPVVTPSSGEEGCSEDEADNHGHGRGHNHQEHGHGAASTAKSSDDDDADATPNGDRHGHGKGNGHASGHDK